VGKGAKPNLSKEIFDLQFNQPKNDDLENKTTQIKKIIVYLKRKWGELNSVKIKKLN
jgi:hypothetical protein